MKKFVNARNTLSNDEFDFQFDLQLFGKGGKSTGKFIGALVVGLWAGGFFGTGAWFASAAHSFTSGLMGASLFSSIWTAVAGQKNNLDFGDSSADIQRFDKAQETMSSTGCVPIVYGQRKVSGNQTFHETNAEQTTLHKHVVLCEGDIEGVEGVSANGLLIPTGSQTNGTVFTLQNTKYPNATVYLSGKTLTLNSSGGSHSIYLCNKEDLETSGGEAVYWSYQTNVSSLISYLNMLGEGWQAFPVAGTYKYPGDLSISFSGNVYNNPTNFTASVVTGGTNYTFNDCITPSNYEEVGAYSHMAWLDMTFTVSSELNGNPSIDCIVKGKKVKDIRTGRTEYSTNPAMCLRDFILSKRYGLGRWFTEEDLDVESWVESANYCDEIISYRTADNAIVKSKRYELNMIIDSKRSAMDWLQEILANFSGFLVFSDGKLKLRIEKPTSISYRFDDSNCKDIQISPLALSETPNRYEITIVDPLNNWSTIKALCEDFADQKTRQKIITKSVSLEGVTSQNQALRLARFYRDYNLVCPLQLTFTTGMQGMHLEPGDVVTISYHNIFDNLPIRINEITETNKGEFEISGRQYNDSIYGDELGGGVQYYNYTVAEKRDEEETAVPPSRPTNLIATTKYREYLDGSTGYDVDVTFNLPANAESVRVYYKTNGVAAEKLGTFNDGIVADEAGWSIAWLFAGESPSSVTIPNAKVGDTYMIRAIAKGSTGLVSEYTSPIYCTVTAKKVIPPQPYDFSFDFTSEIYFSWRCEGIENLDYFELRSNTSIGDNNGLLARTNSTSYVFNKLARKGVVYLFAVNKQGAYSYPVTCEYEQPIPNAPVISTSSTMTGMVISVGDLPSGVIGMKLYIVGDGFNDTITQYSSSYIFDGNAGAYKVRASYIDIFGEGVRSEEVAIVIAPTFSGAYIEDGTITAEKLNEATFNDLAAIQGVKADITELQKEDGLIRTLVADTASGLGSQITQTSDRVTSIVTELGKSPSESSYSAITQLNDALGLKVSSGDVVSSINLSSEGVKIDGKYLHVTGSTQFDSNVITKGVLAANAVSAENIQSKAITADKINISSLSALSATIGTLRTKTTGARVEISDNLIKVYDKNNTLRVELGVFD